jgi:hypothetical protein
MTTIIRPFAINGIDHDILALKSVSRVFMVQKQAAREMKEIRELHEIQSMNEMDALSERIKFNSLMRNAMDRNVRRV